MGTVKSMKQYEGYEAFLGVQGGFEKILKFAVSERLFFLHNGSYLSYFGICETLFGVFSLIYLFFMKIMKIYEGGIFNGFFEFGLLFLAMDMKLGFGFASYNFIKATPSAFGTSPIWGERPNGGGRAEVCCEWA